MKKTIILIIFVILAGMLLTYARRNQPKPISEITGVDFGRIATVATNTEERITAEDFKKQFEDARFKPSAVKNIGSTAHSYYICKDESGDILFTVVDIGNRSLYYLTAGEFDINHPPAHSLFQKITEK